jgi:DNA-binding response OmpR family regulator
MEIITKPFAIDQLARRIGAILRGGIPWLIFSTGRWAWAFLPCSAPSPPR